MSKRFIWNFEIDSQEPLYMPSSESEILSPYMHWESRFFWPEEAIIPLHGLAPSFLELSQYQVKHKQDVYYLLPNQDYNLKSRREQLLYKPLLKKMPYAWAFGKKIVLIKNDKTILPGENSMRADELLWEIQNTGRSCEVEKELLKYRFPSTPPLKLEIAKLNIYHQTYFSLCIESRGILNIKYFIQRVLVGASPISYVTFLKTLC